MSTETISSPSPTLVDPTIGSYGPTAALLWTMPDFRSSLFRYLAPEQLTEALTWSRRSYPQAVKAKYAVIRMMRYRRYQPRFCDPRRSILFHAAPRVLDCTNYVPLLNDPELLSYYLTLFPNVTEIFDNSFRLTFRRCGAGFEDVRLEALRAGHGATGRGYGALTGGDRDWVPRGIPAEWEVELFVRSGLPV